MMDEEKNTQLNEKEVALETFDTVSSEDYSQERAAVSSAYEIKSKLSTSNLLVVCRVENLTMFRSQRVLPA